MVKYSKIIVDAFHITLRNPVLWLFGLFAVGGANVNFLHFDTLRPADLPQGGFLSLWHFFENHPGVLALVSFGILFISVLGLIITNWSRIMLVLSVDSLVQTKFIQLERQWPKSKRVLRPVIQMSLLTSALMIIAAAGLLLPPLLWAKELDSQVLLLAIGGLLLVIVAFTVSCINIFTSFYIILFRTGLLKSLNLGTDLFVARWAEILGLTVVLGIIYGGGFLVGIGLLYLIKTLVLTGVGFLLGFGGVTFFDATVAIQISSGLLLWVFTAGLSVFFNTALLLFFFQINTPLKAEEKTPEMMPTPAVG